MTGRALTPKQEAWPTDRPKPYPANPRQITDKAIAKVARSIEEFGFQQPIVVDTQGVIIAGHTRLAAAKQLQLAQVPVIIADLPEAKVRAYRLADNRTAQETSWLDDLLGEELTALQELDFDLDAIGFDEAELRALMSDDEELDRAEQTPDVPEEAVSRLGDLWHLGEHRVYCGDATNAGHVAQVLSERKPHLMVTSPPYNQKIDGFKPSGMHKEHNWVSKVARLAYPDQLPEPDYQKSQIELLQFWFERLADGASVFYNHKNRYRDKRVISPLEWLPGPFKIRQEIVWRRPGSVTQNARMFLPCDERIYWMYKGKNFSFNDRTEIKTWSTVWDIAPRTNSAHAVAFPVELPLRCIQAVAGPGTVVIDPFLGSGTTLIAAEMEGRICLGLELHPPYVDVIVQRWQDFTGREATRLDGTPFNALQPDTIGTAAGQHRPGRSNQQARA